jgi:hypothetical protein
MEVDANRDSSVATSNHEIYEIEIRESRFAFTTGGLVIVVAIYLNSLKQKKASTSNPNGHN